MHLIKERLDTIILGSSRGLIMSHTPKGITLDQVANTMSEHPVDTSRCGLFDTASPNYHTYYPDVEAKDFTPSNDDYFEPTVRALSEVIVHKQYNPVDFGVNGVLKNSMNLLYAQSIYVDHETSTGNSLGSVAEVAWQESYKAGAILVPSGINARLRIDGKSHVNIVRKMSMTPPAIHSLSVTVQFAYEPSHQGLSEEEFYRKLGTYDKDGQMYRRIATKVKSFKEISLVGHGADPYAQLIRDGKITNPKYADVVYNTADGNPKGKEVENGGKPAGVKYYVVDFKEGLIANSEHPTIPEQSINNDDSPTNPLMKKETLLLLAIAMGLKTDGMDEAALTAAVEPAVQSFLANTQVATDSVATLTAKVTELEGKVTAAEAKASEAEGKLTAEPKIVAFGTTALSELRAETKRLHALISGSTPDAATVELIESAEPQVLNILIGQYKAQEKEKFPLTCQKCSSTEVSRGSAKLEEAPDPSKGGNPTPVKTDLRAKYMQKQLQEATRMHGTTQA